MPIVKLDQLFITHKLHCPAGKQRVEFCDSELPGMYILVAAKSPGIGTYYLRYKDDTGKTAHQKISRTSDISLLDARKQAKTLKAEIALGANPQAEQKKQKAVLTYAEFFDNHYLPYVKPRKRSWYSDESLFRNRLKAAFGNKRLNQITRQQIQSFHTALQVEGLAAATCNHHVKLLKHSLNMAIDWDLLDGPNPASRVPLFFEDNKVENYLDDAELDRLLTVLRADPKHTVSQIALLLLSTGCRLNEILSAKWSDVDLVKHVFVVRVSNSKSKKLRSVPLNDSAVDILKNLETKDRETYLFMNKQTGKPYHSINRVWQRLRVRAGLPHLRIHDLRHMYASFLVNDGQSLYSVQTILGHSDAKVTMRYAHLSKSALQEAANSASIMIKDRSEAAA